MDQVWKLQKKAIDKVNKEEKNKYKTLKDLSFLLSLFNHQIPVYTSYPNFFMPNGTLTQTFVSGNVTNFLVWSSSVQQLPAIFSFQFPSSTTLLYSIYIGFGSTPGLNSSVSSVAVWTDIIVQLSYQSSGQSVININQSGTGVQLYGGTASSILAGGIITIDALASNSSQYKIQFNGTSTPSLASYITFPKNPVTQPLYFTYGLSWNGGAGGYSTAFSMVQTPGNLLPQ